MDPGNVVFALPSTGELIIFQATGKDYQKLARYKVTEGNTYAFPVISGKRIYVKDKDSLTLWTLE